MSNKSTTARLGAFAAGVMMLFGVSAASAAVIAEIEANDTHLTAQNIDPFFDLSFNTNIGDVTGANTSLVIPHVTIRGTGNGTFDHYSFTGVAGNLAIFDIDFGTTGVSMDAWLDLFNPAGAIIATNDDFITVAGAGGSASALDSFIQVVLPTTGLYSIRVGTFCCPGPVPSGADYTLQVSTTVPEPGTLALFGLGLAGLGFARRRKVA